MAFDPSAKQAPLPASYVVLVCENPKCPKPNREFQMAEKLAARTAGTHTFCSSACYQAYEQRWD